VIETSSGITRRKGQSGRATTVECTLCGAKIPRDKAVERSRYSFRLDRNLRALLREKGAKLHNLRRVAYYCISCAKHRRYV
jgi:small subunit ribosomal protein S26e